MINSAQNRVAVSRFTLPAVMFFSIAVWLASGQLSFTVPSSLAELWQGGWVRFACFLVSVFLVIVLNNNNGLIRVYSRTVSCAFVVLMCAGNFLFNSTSAALVQIFMIAFYLAIFQTYQDKTAVGWSYYAFLCVGLASCLFVQILFFVPVLWLMMFFQLSSFSWRMFCASLLGLVTPYWFMLPLLFFHGNAEAMAAHFMALADFSVSDSISLTVNKLLFFVFVVALGITGTVHYYRKKLDDNIRIRLLYGCFILMWLVTGVFLVLQPQHYDMLVRLLVICVSPLIAHFLTFTNTRITNIAFHVIWVAALLMTLFNLWMPSLLF